MRKIIPMLMWVIPFLFSSCEEEQEEHQVTYEFTADRADQYRFSYAVDSNNELSETVNSTTWTKTVNMPDEAGFGNPTIAAVTVFPPATWANTASSAKIKLSIYVDGTLATSKDTTLTAKEISMGIRELASF